MTKKAKKTKVAKATPENEGVSKAKKAAKALEKYLKENKLDPKKDWSKDKKHGKEVRRLMDLVNLQSDKVEEKTNKEKKISKNPTEKPQVKDKATKEGKKKASSSDKYDYPDVDGRPMTPEEKKKYRAKLRREAGGKQAKPSKKEDKPAKEAKDKKSKKASKEEPTKEKKADKKSDKKKKKAKK